MCILTSWFSLRGSFSGRQCQGYGQEQAHMFCVPAPQNPAVLCCGGTLFQHCWAQLGCSRMPQWCCRRAGSIREFQLFVLVCRALQPAGVVQRPHRRGQQRLRGAREPHSQWVPGPRPSLLCSSADALRGLFALLFTGWFHHLPLRDGNLESDLFRRQ